MPKPLSELPVGKVLEQLGAPGTAPGGGSAASLATAMAAALVSMVARRPEGSWPEAAGIAAQASILESRALELADTGAAAFGGALEALERGSDVVVPLDAAAETMLVVADTAADVAILAGHTAQRCDGAFRGDAIAAAALADAATRAAAALVEANLTVVPSDERVARVRQLVELAAGGLAQALESAR